MMRVAVYDLTSGQILRIVQGPADLMPLQAGPGESIIEAPPGITDATHRVVGGVFTPLPQPEPDYWAAVRAERDAKLRATDWAVIRELEQGVPMPPGMRAYRQALRDVTSQPDPQAIVWPIHP